MLKLLLKNLGDILLKNWELLIPGLKNGINKIIKIFSASKQPIPPGSSIPDGPIKNKGYLKIRIGTEIDRYVCLMDVDNKTKTLYDLMKGNPDTIGDKECELLQRLRLNEDSQKIYVNVYNKNNKVKNSGKYTVNTKKKTVIYENECRIELKRISNEYRLNPLSGNNRASLQDNYNIICPHCLHEMSVEDVYFGTEIKSLDKSIDLKLKYSLFTKIAGFKIENEANTPKKHFNTLEINKEINKIGDIKKYDSNFWNILELSLKKSPSDSEYANYKRHFFNELKYGMLKRYCPKCKKRLSEYSGIYPTKVISMWGLKESGKTTFIASIFSQCEEFSNSGTYSLCYDDASTYNKEILEIIRERDHSSKDTVRDFDKVAVFNYKKCDGSGAVIVINDIAGEDTQNIDQLKTDERLKKIRSTDAFILMSDESNRSPWKKFRKWLNKRNSMQKSNKQPSSVENSSNEYSLTELVGDIRKAFKHQNKIVIACFFNKADCVKWDREEYKNIELVLKNENINFSEIYRDCYDVLCESFFFAGKKHKQILMDMQRLSNHIFFFPTVSLCSEKIKKSKKYSTVRAFLILLKMLDL